MSSKPQIEVIQQGKTVIERDGGGYLVMHPDGEVEGASTKRKAESKARAWYKSALGNDGARIGVGEIEWRRP